MRPRDLPSLAVALAVLLAGWWWSDRPRPVADPGSVPPACAAPAMAWRDDRGALRDWSRPVRLASNGALFACLPAAGTLRFSMRGDAALARGAHAVVVVDAVPTWDAPVVAPVEMELAVEAGSSVLVAFTNDLYRSAEEDRALWLSAVDFAPR